MPVTRPLASDDAPALAELLTKNREFLAPWTPSRNDDYFTVQAQQKIVTQALEKRDRGTSVPLAICDAGRIEGMITVQSIVRGFFQSCSVGYWLAETAQGRGLATAALREVTELAFRDLRLHRIQAETLPHNERSQRVLRRLGFEAYGTAKSYLKIAGTWQDSNLYQLLTDTPELVEVPE